MMSLSAVVNTAVSQDECPGFNPTGGQGVFRIVFAVSCHAQVGFLWILWLPSNVHLRDR